VKHSKYKNTGILFELLVRQVTSDTINGVESSPAIAIIREFFKKNTSLKKELGLYQTLLKEKFKTEGRANAFINAVLNERKKLSNSTLRKQKYNLIKEIKSHYSVEDFFKSKVSNYSDNASVYCLFEDTTPSKQVRSRYSLVESITNSKLTKSRVDETYDMVQKQDKDVRMLSYKILLEKFNEKYGTLGGKQKTLLKEYIENISNTQKLKEYIHGEINTTTKKLDKASKFVKNKIVKIKLKEVSNQLKNIKNEKNIKDSHFISVLRTYDLIKEIANVIK
tara:strand:- start:2067 stop:2903 length:837 start_codon:yes stop_codon:yes gene_type:complete